MEYRKIILDKLINKYERSKISKGVVLRNIKITLKFDYKGMNDYVCEDSYKYIDKIEGAVLSLEHDNYIEVVRKNNRIIKVNLNINYLNDIYKELNKKTKNNIKNDYLTLIDKYNTNIEVNTFRDFIVDKLDNNQSTIKYFENYKELEDILKILSNLNKENIIIRNFSAKYLNDSKKLENISPRINNIIKDIFKSNSNFYEFLESYNIYKNPTYIYIKGHVILKIYDTVINLNNIGGEFMLTSNQVENLEILSLGNKIITVENLATYHTIDSKNNLVIYLGGFHNKIKNQLLRKIYEFDKNKKFIHIGDIDAGGFYILNHLIEDTNILFTTYKMDIDTLKQYKNFCKKLTTNDIKRLNKLKEIKRLEEYYEVFDYMLENNIKLEQENIDY